MRVTNSLINDSLNYFDNFCIYNFEISICFFLTNLGSLLRGHLQISRIFVVRDAVGAAIDTLKFL